MTIEFVDGSPGGGPCVACGAMDETRMGVCWDCACAGEEKAARRSVVQHIGHGLMRVARGRFDFGTRMDFMWAWERLTKTGDYAPGGEFDRQYFNPRQLDSTVLSGPMPSVPTRTPQVER